MIQYISSDEILRLLMIMIRRYGGAEGIRDWGLIESALARPQAGFRDQEAYPDLFMKAAVLLFSLIKNHGSVDGNKRTAIAASGIFLSLNGYILIAAQEALVDFTVAIAEGKESEEEISNWLRIHSQSI